MKAIFKNNAVKSLALITFAFGSISLTLNAHATAQAGASASVTVIKALTIMKATDLSFGKIATGSLGAGGTVTISAGASGDRSQSGPLFLAAGDVGSSAQFTVNGEPNANISVSIPSEITLTKSGGGGSMTVSSVQSSATGGIATLTGLGEYSFFVGGTLTVANNQTDGSYTGTFVVGVDYN
jgi:hypothetical protein